MTIDVVSEISSIQVINQQIQILPILEGANHIDNKLMIKFAQNILFIHYRIHTFLRDNFGLVHHFQSISFPSFFLIDFPDSAETTLPNNLLKLKHSFII